MPVVKASVGGPRSNAEPSNSKFAEQRAIPTSILTPPWIINMPLFSISFLRRPRNRNYRCFAQILVWAILGFALIDPAKAWIDYAPNGFATMTHYTLPQGFVASCGCSPAVTNYPTVALSQMAYGSSRSYGSSCGRCFNLTLINPLVSTPPFFPNVTKHVVVKVVDLCPLSKGGWCSGTDKKPNPAGAFLNFDLAYPSIAIPEDFFPSDQATYGYKDFGVWNITYHSVPCLKDWAGSDNDAALGSVRALGSSGCCPADPLGDGNNPCPSYSDEKGLPPDTMIAAASHLTSHFALTGHGISLFILIYHFSQYLYYL